MSRPNHIVEPGELMAYLDGELPAEEALDTAAHLERCPECQTLAAELKEVSGMLTGWEVEEVREELPARIASELDNRREENSAPLVLRRWPRFTFPTRRGMLWRGALAAAALIIFALTNPKFSRNASLGHTVQVSLPSLQDAIPMAKPLPNAGRNAETDKKLAAGGGGGVGAAGKLQASSRSVPGRFSPAQSDINQDEVEESVVDNAVDLKTPMIIRTADLGVTVKGFEKARSAVDEILKRHYGHVGGLSVNTPSGAARSLTGTLRVPSKQLDAALSELKNLGRVEKESQSGEEVTEQYVDLQARLANSKHTEERLTEILRDRTGKLSDVLAVEMQISRVRGEIEEMEAQRKTMKNQVDFATLNLTLTEEYKKELNVAPPSTGTQLRNAAIDGYRSLVDGIIAVLLWLISAGPTLLVWFAILFFPVRMAWRRIAATARDRRHRA